MRSFVQIQVFARKFHLCLSCPSSPAVILDPRRRTSRTGAATPPAVIPDLSCCHPRPRSGIQGLGGRCLERCGTTRRSSPTGSWCLCVGAGLGARPSFLFSCGVSAPHDEVLLFRQKNPKPLAPGRGPPEGVPVPRSLLLGLRNSLRSDSPRRQNGRDWTGAQPRPQAPGGGLFFCHPCKCSLIR